MTTLSLEESRTKLTAATDALTSVQEQVTSTTNEFLDAINEVKRLTALIATGDRQAMTDILDARALANGLKVHLNDLKLALASATETHTNAVAVEQRARAVHRDVEGLLSPEEIKALWAGLAEQVDALHFPVLDKLKAHGDAIQVLGSFIDASNKVLGTNTGFSTTREHGSTARVTSATINGQLVHPSYPSQDSDDAVKKSRDRYNSAEIEATKEALATQARIDREELERIEATTAYPDYSKTDNGAGAIQALKPVNY